MQDVNEVISYHKDKYYGALVTAVSADTNEEDDADEE